MGPIQVLFVLLATSLLLLASTLRYRQLWKRAQKELESRGGAADGVSPQLMNAVDAIALEVERVSEGQRFLTRVLAEGNESSPPRAPERPVKPITPVP